jgi:hypothetical protein
VEVKMSADDLPIEIWEIIIAFEGQLEQVISRLVCHSWKQLVEQRWIKGRPESQEHVVSTFWIVRQAALAKHSRLLKWACTQCIETGKTYSLMICAMISESLEMVQWLKGAHIPITSDSLAWSGAFPLIQIIDWYYNLANTSTENGSRALSRMAFRANRNDVLHWMQEHKIPISYNYLIKAAKHGHLELVKEYLSLSTITHIIIFVVACKHRQYAIMQYLMDTFIQTLDISDWLAEYGNMDMITRLLEKENLSDAKKRYLFLNAARSNNAEVAIYLMDKITSIYPEDLTDLIFGGNLIIVKWGFNHCSWIAAKEEIPHRHCYTNIATRQGHLEVLQFLAKEGVPINSKTMNIAIKNGHLRIVEWLKELQIIEIWPKKTLTNAVNSGSLQVIKLVLDYHPKKIKMNLTGNFSQHVVRLLLKYHRTSIIGAYIWAVRRGHLNFAEWLKPQLSEADRMLVDRM